MSKIDLVIGTFVLGFVFFLLAFGIPVSLMPSIGENWSALVSFILCFIGAFTIQLALKEANSKWMLIFQWYYFF